jgi:hypothetical protein
LRFTEPTILALTLSLEQAIFAKFSCLAVLPSAATNNELSKYAVGVPGSSTTRACASARSVSAISQAAYHGLLSVQKEAAKRRPSSLSFADRKRDRQQRTVNR